MSNVQNNEPRKCKILPRMRKTIRIKNILHNYKKVKKPFDFFSYLRDNIKCTKEFLKKTREEKQMYLFNKITVNPQLPKRIEKLSEIANNLWWSWNTDFLKLFKIIDIDLWENIGKNPIKFLKMVPQEKLEEYAQNNEFLKEYDRIVNNFENYMNSKNTLFNKKFPENKNDIIAYFSAEYGLDEIMQIYSGGLGILSGDHLKAASDLGIPLVGIGLLYKKGYFHQVINSSRMARRCI